MLNVVCWMEMFETFKPRSGHLSAVRDFRSGILPIGAARGARYPLFSVACISILYSLCLLRLGMDIQTTDTRNRYLSRLRARRDE